MPSNTGNKLDFAGRTAVVTGGSQGIGFGTAKRLLASGANVSIWAVDQDRLEQAASKLVAIAFRPLRSTSATSPRSRPLPELCLMPTVKSTYSSTMRASPDRT
jgi:NAD(P)-dependent dehydrogenase (short-subunit alcohol dehydrogenase family)